PAEKLVTVGNTLTGNITSHTQLYSTYDSQNNVLLEVGYGTSTSADTPIPDFILSKNLTGTSNLAGRIIFANRSIADGSEKRLAQIVVVTNGASNSGDLAFATTNAGTLSEVMRISKSGYVGIGTTSPGRPLVVTADASGIPLRVYRNANTVGFGTGIDWAFNNSA